MLILVWALSWNAARAELFDFSLHNSESAVCTTATVRLGRYSLLSYKRFIYTAAWLGVPGRLWRRPCPRQPPGAGAQPSRPAWAAAGARLKSARARAGRRCVKLKPLPTDRRRLAPALHPPTSRSHLQPARLYTPTALMRVAPSPALMIPVH